MTGLRITLAVTKSKDYITCHRIGDHLRCDKPRIIFTVTDLGMFLAVTDLGMVLDQTGIGTTLTVTCLKLP